MGTVSFSASALIFIVLIVGVIAIFPENLCLPFTTTCVFLEPLHFLKNTMFYGGTVFLYFAILISFMIGITKVLTFFKKNKLFITIIQFIFTLDERSYEKMKRQITR